MPDDEVDDDDGLRAFVDALIDDDLLPDPSKPSPRKVRRSEGLRVIRDFLETAEEACALMPAAAEAMGVKLACLEGCSYCCEQLVLISASEADIIAEWLSAPGREALLEGFHKRAGRWLVKCGPPALRALTAMGQARLGDARIASREVALQHQLCPLHDGNRCTAYEVRPLICRKVYVAHTNEHCRATTPPRQAEVISRPEHDHFFDAAGRVARGLQYGMGQGLLFQALPVAVSNALERLAEAGAEGE